MGSFLRVRVHYGELAQLLAGLPAIYGALLEGAPSYRLGQAMEGALLIGSESHGISAEARALITHPLTIPRFGTPFRRIRPSAIHPVADVRPVRAVSIPSPTSVFPPSRSHHST